MNSKYLLLDVANLAHRAMHTVSEMRHPDNPDMATGVLYQIGATAEKLQGIYGTWNVAFYFDSRHRKRQELYAGYKADRDAKRASDSDEMKLRRKQMYEQVNALPKLLHQMGCQNIYGQTGYEADDLIASTVINNPLEDFVVVSRDEDLLQLLSPSVQIHDLVTKQPYTVDDFWKEYEISPTQWASVKAWAGCSTDNVPGLPGVGTVTAVKYLRGKLADTSAKYKLFVENLEVYTRNIELVRLPLKGANEIKLTPQATPIKWSILAEHIGAVTFGWDMPNE
jgi:DNA polymerase-1